MTSNPVVELLAFLGIGRTHSRPHVSNDNPFSESHFKTLKYCPAFPERFGCIQDARAFCETFLTYYKHEHRHSGIGYHTPASATQVRARRQVTLDADYAANPTRFRHRWPQPPRLPTVAWINEPTEEVAEPMMRSCLKMLGRLRVVVSSFSAGELTERALGAVLHPGIARARYGRLLTDGTGGVAYGGPFQVLSVFRFGRPRARVGTVSWRLVAR